MDNATDFNTRPSGLITGYHACYYAHELRRTGGAGLDRIGRALFDACLDLNPHQADAAQYAQATTRRSLEVNNQHFQERRDQLYRWAEDVVRAAERDLDLAKAEVRAANRAASLAATVEEQKRTQEQVREMERKKRRARQRIFEVEDEVEATRDALIEALEKKMVQNIKTQPLFLLRWTIV